MIRDVNNDSYNNDSSTKLSTQRWLVKPDVLPNLIQVKLFNRGTHFIFVRVTSSGHSMTSLGPRPRFLHELGNLTWHNL